MLNKLGGVLSRVRAGYVLWCALGAGAWFTSASALHAQVKPRIVVGVDTSSSMLLDLSGQPTWGDGVGIVATNQPSMVLDGVYYGCGTTAGLDRNCDGWPNDSRMAIAKDAIRKMVLAFGDVEWALSKFHQTHQLGVTCTNFNSGGSCDTNFAYGSPQCNTSSTTSTSCTSTIPLTCRPGSGSNSPLRVRRSVDFNGCINYNAGNLISCPNSSPADLLVGFPGIAPFAGLDNRAAILKWMDNVETSFNTGVTVGNFCNHAGAGDCELRPHGRTPLGALIQTSGQYATSTRNSDADSACRQYSVILVTDGAETCETDPTRRAYELAYAATGACPATLPTTTPSIRTYVVGISIQSGDQASLNDIARCGGTGEAYFAADANELSAALSDIVGRSIPVELCNGRDDDCDSLIDEGLPRGVPGNAAQAQSLFCDREGNRSATQNNQVRLTLGMPSYAQGTAVQTPIVCGRVTDTCENRNTDDDCDGAIDEDGNLNACGECPGATETCDGRDNDCDGTIDETPGTGNPFSLCPIPCTGNVPCGNGVGECEQGMYVCTGNVLDTSVCENERGPSMEICDELDNDCNGIVDDPAITQRACTTPWGTTGICIPGTQFCAKPSMGEDEDTQGYRVDSNGNPVCVGAVPPEDRELCDLLDHDCNGDPFTCTTPGCIQMQPVGVGDPCGQGVGSCRGVLECDEAAMPPALVCNAPGGSPEICDGLDNDCDGAADEGLGGGGACGSGVGECRPGTYMCDPSGNQVCVGGIEPIAEVCDALDNDCDGKVDEGLGLGEPCGSDEGACQPGTQVCSNGRIICDGEIGPQFESCDCTDNDCDGQIDEGTGDNPVCPGESVCTMCQCSLPCAGTEEFQAQCPQGKAAITDDQGACYCVAERCNEQSCQRRTIELSDEIQCAPNNDRVAMCRCQNNECSFACAGVSCGDGLVCDPTDGRCRKSSCLLPQFACESNLRCALSDGVFECAEDPCAFKVCETGQACRDGECYGSCAEVTCGDGERCVDGACEPDRCRAVTCGDLEVCNPSDGQCTAAGQCTRAGCPDGMRCDAVSGECVEHVCLRTRCPTGQRCDSDTGQCESRCQGGEVFCGGQCINPSSSRRYCGASGDCNGDNEGENCASGLVCSLGECSGSCAENLVDCNGECVDPRTDPNHCGASDDCAESRAGATCVEGETCRDGTCRTDAPIDPNTPDAGGGGGRQIIATGGGGCACSVGPGSAPSPIPVRAALALFGLALCALRLGRRRVRARAARAVAPWLAALVVTLSSLGSGCKVESFCLDCETARDGGSVQPPPDAGNIDNPGDSSVTPPADTGVPADTGAGELDATAGDATVGRPDGGCVEIELCNGLDDDCDGTADEDADPTASNVDILTNARHCGGCGKTCAIDHAYNRCVDGACVIDTTQGDQGCDIGYHNLDGDAENGCEYRCIKTADDDTACNLVDNDCDGNIDEDVDPTNDPLNCGRCGLRCIFANAADGATCTNKTCALDNTKCDEGYVDADGKPATGCEYHCPVTPPTNERCNGLDDDCDSKIDEGIANADDSRIGAVCGSTVGACETGTTVCLNGAPDCDGDKLPAPELCDGLDNDCDNKLDEGFDRNIDPGNCGSCGTKCLLDANIPNGHAILICNGGTCDVGACIGNYANTDGNYRNGCETECTISGNEVCDGIDNDCDGTIDDAVSAPSVVCTVFERGVCAANAGTLNALRTLGPSCSDAVLGCNPAAAAAMIPNFQATETLCDGLDNDCDGFTDEMIPAIGQPCTRGQGACTTTGVNVCDGPSAYRCSAPTPGSGSAETCNGEDDNCDGIVDNFAPPTLANTVGGFDLVDIGSGVLVMSYEASRPDADEDEAGVLTHKPCSAEDRVPWANVTWAEADAACCALNANGQCQAMNRGWRLCDASTWQRACRGESDTCAWGYSNETGALCNHAANVSLYNDVCLGAETAIECDGTATECADVTGSDDFPECRAVHVNNGTEFDIFDMSGNLKEWTRTSPSAGLYQIRGGSYNNIEAGRTCNFNFTVGNTSFRFPNTGFRCCYYP